MKSKYYYDDLKLLEKLNLPIKKSLRSPFREDKNPSFSIFENNGYIRWKDFGTGEYGTIPELYKKLMNQEIIYKRSYEYKEPKLDKKKHITVKPKEFSQKDLEYWSQYYIHQQILNIYQIESLEEFQYGNKIYKNKKYMFSIKYSEGIYKIYMPGNDIKFFHNCNSSHIYGQYQINKQDKRIIITKSFKDVMVLYLLGYNSVSIMSETIQPMSIKYFVDYCINHQYKLYLLLDNDITGIKNTINWKNVYPFIKVLILDKHKDISDYILYEGLENTKQYINYFI